ncbi:uncharacterized protein LOC27207640 [Drosophila simulans]|uniref:Kazal-like domain-containing protein n=1 Tax=Drosophila simulans TaxID=7240 RepID=A0A0J9RPS8_DROSI|nr:uncharacterized protein LOC27207640 [Drosophila simulans]KMY97906.1 uncharacterized protein Dsimw501_GD27791 [Drosophila simulans]
MNAVGIFVIFLACSLGANIPPKPCQVESNCGQVNETSSICGLDEEMGCIRKFPTKCHLDIAFCVEGKNFTDFNEEYCSMESYLCEISPTYERWTIFFGNEN